MLKVAIVGAGTMGSVHSNSYRSVRGAKVVAICDIRPDRATKAASAHGAKCYEDYDMMLRNEKIDVVDICLPTYMHKGFALKAISYGKHVFCEKPIALSIGDAREMVDGARNRGVKFSVGHVVRFFPAYAKAVKNIKEGKIGIPKLIRTTRTGAYPSWSWNNWYSNYDCSGGPMVDLIIHDIDWIRYNFGDVERVFARDLYGRKIDNLDHCLITLRLKNGAIAHIEGSWAYPKGSIFGTTFEIIGTKGQIEFDSRSSAPIKKYVPNGDAVRTSIESPMFPDEEPYTMEIQKFIDCITENKKPLVSGEDAIKALEISLAAVKSARTKEVVLPGGDN
ncbi:MAG: Gfo/Idh/MocA family oxidoreductase [Clostridiales bacterium]|nr:Gfo/Idh/MocA family oxidoreductase [Clostridiales bacterium]